MYSKISLICHPLSGSLLLIFFLNSDIFCSDFVTSALRPASLTQSKSPKAKIIHGMRPFRTQKLIDLNMRV